MRVLRGPSGRASRVESGAQIGRMSGCLLLGVRETETLLAASHSA